MSLILIRGLPGSGKSTMAQTLIQLLGYTHLEADMYHMKDGEYQYDPAKAKEAHLWCQLETMKALARFENVVVSNTFTQWWEMKPYINMAELMGREVRIAEAKGTWANIHNVPEDVISKMRTRWEYFEETPVGETNAS